jgi:catalase
MPSQQVFNNKDGAVYTTSNGAIVAEPYAAERIGQIGPLLLQGMFCLLAYLSITDRLSHLLSTI